MYAVSRVSKNSLPSKEWKSLMKRMKGKARAFRIFIPIPLQTGKEEKLLPTSRTQDTAFLSDYFVDASRYSSSRLDLAYTTRNEISLKFGSYKILAPFLPHCPFPPPPPPFSPSPHLPISPHTRSSLQLSSFSFPPPNLIIIMSRATQPSTAGRGEKAQDGPYVAQRTFYGEWEIPVPNAVPAQPTAERFQQTHEPDPFINVSFEPRHHYPPIAPAGKLDLQSPKSTLRTASSKLDRLSHHASASPSFQPSSNTGSSNPGAKQRQVRTCSLCNEPGHNMFTCPKRPCTRCQQMGHVKTYCDVAKEAANQVSKARVQRNKAIVTTKNVGKFVVSRNSDIQDGPVSRHEGEGTSSTSSWERIMLERQSERMGEGKTRRVRIDDLLNPK